MPPISKKLSNMETAELAREAYVFAFPQAYYYLYMYPQAITEVPGKDYFGGFNTFKNYGLATPEQQIGVPNVDTPYSRAWVDTRTEPIVLTMPPCTPENRFYSSVWADLWGFILDYPGSVKDDNEGAATFLYRPGGMAKSRLESSASSRVRLRCSAA